MHNRLEQHYSDETFSYTKNDKINRLAALSGMACRTISTPLSVVYCHRDRTWHSAVQGIRRFCHAPISWLEYFTSTNLPGTSCRAARVVWQYVGMGGNGWEWVGRGWSPDPSPDSARVSGAALPVRL